jgi:hypothetical protein
VSSRFALRRLTVATMLLIAAACAPTQPYAKIDESAEPLRARFNADAGRVRVMMLVAPT